MCNILWRRWLDLGTIAARRVDGTPHEHATHRPQNNAHGEGLPKFGWAVVTAVEALCTTRLECSRARGRGGGGGGEHEHKEEDNEEREEEEERGEEEDDDEENEEDEEGEDEGEGEHGHGHEHEGDEEEDNAERED